MRKDLVEGIDFTVDEKTKKIIWRKFKIGSKVLLKTLCDCDDCRKYRGKVLTISRAAENSENAFYLKYNGEESRSKYIEYDLDLIEQKEDKQKICKNK